MRCELCGAELTKCDRDNAWNHPDNGCHLKNITSGEHTWGRINAAIRAAREEALKPYALFEELSPPDVPRAEFVKWCFDAWERENERNPKAMGAESIPALLEQTRESFREGFQDGWKAAMQNETIQGLLERIAELEEKCGRISQSNGGKTPGANTAETASTLIGSKTSATVDAPETFSQPTEQKDGPTPTKPGVSDGSTAYLVIAHRGGDRENHSYPVGIAQSLQNAKEIKEAAEQYRGGKYSCAIWSFTVGETDFDKDSEKEISGPTPIPGWKTATERIMDDQRRDSRIAELDAQLAEARREHSDPELMEILADIEHQRWADWQVWCHKILRENCPSPELEKVLERWDRQIATKYADLSEKEKQSDRDQVMRYWHLIQARRERRPEQCRHFAFCRKQVFVCPESESDTPGDMAYLKIACCPCAAWEKKGGA